MSVEMIEDKLRELAPVVAQLDQQAEEGIQGPLARQIEEETPDRLDRELEFAVLHRASLPECGPLYNAFSWYHEISL